MSNRFKKIMVVDESKTNLSFAKNTLGNKYDVYTAKSGHELFRQLEDMLPDLILLEIEMPGQSGFDIIRLLKADDNTAAIPVIVLTGKSDPSSEFTSLSIGAVDYIKKPFSPTLLLKRVEIHLLLESQKRELELLNSSLQTLVSQKTNTVLELQTAVITAMAELVEYRDSVTGGHIERTQRYLQILVESMFERKLYINEISQWNIDQFLQSAQLHDVGKIAISDSILKKPSTLTVEEFDEMKTHTTFGMRIIQHIEERTTESDFLKHAEILAGSHHERWDGSGYPFGLAGTQIPLQGRLMALADVYDALTTQRPYKEPYPHEEAVAIMKSEIRSHFDPYLSVIFLDCAVQFEHVARQFCD